MMHAICGYPVKSTWLKAIKAGHYAGWPLLKLQNVRKYYLKTKETPKEHMNQTHKNMRSTKLKHKSQRPIQASNDGYQEGSKSSN